MDFEENKELDNVNEVLKDSTLNNPDLTFCEKTTYFDFLLSNAKTDEEKEQIKQTINGYLDIYNGTHEEDDEEEDE